MKEPLVSILTPTYNHEKYITECIESVLSQTFPDWEQIIIDDGSTDKTCEIINTYCEKDKRIKLIKQVHQGIENLKNTYNKALSVAKGEYIAILEGDDFWPKNKLEIQLSLFDDKKVILTWGKACIVTEDNKFVKSIPQQIENFLNINEKNELITQLLLKNFLPAVTVIIKKEAILSIKGFRQVSYLPTVDYPTWLKLALLALLKDKTFVGSKNVLGYWRRHGSQITTIKEEEFLIGDLKLVYQFYVALPSYIKEKLNVNLKDIITYRYNQIAGAYMYNGRKQLVRRKLKDAKIKFMNAYKFGNTKIKIKALIGLLATYAHFDIEKIMKFLGKETVK